GIGCEFLIQLEPSQMSLGPGFGGSGYLGEQLLVGGIVLDQVIEAFLIEDLPANDLADLFRDGPAARASFAADRDREPAWISEGRRGGSVAAIAVDGWAGKIGRGRWHGLTSNIIPVFQMGEQPHPETCEDDRGARQNGPGGC